MTPEERFQYVRYRLEKSEETFEVAQLLVVNSKWNSAINRLYYAAYYAISALLFQSGLSTKTHTGVKTSFFLQYIKTDKISVELGKVYSDLFDSRQKGDYGDIWDFTEEEVSAIIEPTRELIEAVRREIEKQRDL
ncbi:HEPN domain-containing protein [Persicitalea jodogahamensis]|uniref:DNA-binding protein n=1 Tax=Persicitalea jodogahamensis TaxID=402147 RepID=A0A8J3D452_9BACT|nr:HEPN domain-containing protein [Persicitalea jodogahamensis]GHB71933.1 DNA-binding protein [Persicitalea jodogahamensis]